MLNIAAKLQSCKATECQGYRVSAVKCLIIFFCGLICFLGLGGSVYAQGFGGFPGSGLDFPVSARVGEFYLSVSGYISPYASVVLSSDDTFYRATVADGYGNFAISQVLIRRGFSHFCLEAVDFKRLGSSYTCFDVAPATSDVEMRDIFLPPTIGLQRNEIVAGGDAVVFGYTMAGADVAVHLNTGETPKIVADSHGYYAYQWKKVRAGYYTLFATATYKGKPSVKPTRSIYLRALSLGQQLAKLANDIGKWLWPRLMNPLWLLFPLLVLITFLVFKLWPERFTFIYERWLAFLFRRKKRLHHWWFVGY